MFLQYIFEQNYNSLLITELDSSEKTEHKYSYLRMSSTLSNLSAEYSTLDNSQKLYAYLPITWTWMESTDGVCG